MQTDMAACMLFQGVQAARSSRRGLIGQDMRVGWTGALNATVHHVLQLRREGVCAREGRVQRARLRRAGALCCVVTPGGDSKDMVGYMAACSSGPACVLMRLYVMSTETASLHANHAHGVPHWALAASKMHARHACVQCAAMPRSWRGLWMDSPDNAACLAALTAGNESLVCMSDANEQVSLELHS